MANERDKPTVVNKHAMPTDANRKPVKLPRRALLVCVCACVRPTTSGWVGRRVVCFCCVLGRSRCKLSARAALQERCLNTPRGWDCLCGAG